jgi:cell wall-associated NlpC family hydrolase
MIAADLIARALSAIGHGCIYALGKGGMNPDSTYPWNKQKQCDCSGFVAWALGVSRHTDHPWYKDQNGGWLETSAIARDALTRGLGMFDLVTWREAKPGHLIVYGDTQGHQGHVGIVTACSGEGPMTAVHCSRGNQTRSHDAIQETGVTVWIEHNGIVARCALVEG